MRTWMKYLIIGWSIVSVGIIIATYHLVKRDFVEENSAWGVVWESLFKDQDPLGLLPKDSIKITEKEFIDRAKKAEGITIISKTKVEPIIYWIVPMYSFLVWAIPILVFSLVGVIFGREKRTQMKQDLGK